MSEQDNNNKKTEKFETLRALGKLSQIGFTVAASILVGVFVGRFLDSLLGTEPWLLLAFSLFGVGAAFKALFNISKEK